MRYDFIIWVFMRMKNYIQKLINGHDLTRQQARDAMEMIMSGKATDAQIAAFLTALRLKGETPTEVASMATVMREFAANINPDVTGTLVDTCGTGGDKLNTFNVSTTAMFVVSGAKIPIAKHGNRSITSKSGSADVLEALGVKIDLPPPRVEECIEKIGIGFMFAPIFHKAMKYVMPARKQLGIRTVFNILGPLTNPANAKGQVIGVYSEELTEKMAEVLKLVGLERAFVVHGLHGLDELSTLGKTKVSELRDGEVRTYHIKPEDFGVKRAKEGDLTGGDAMQCAGILKDIVGGKETKETKAKRDIVLLNAAAGIVVGKKADSLGEGLEIAKDSIDSGNALKKLNELIDFR